jgi:hypothetical protein
MSLRFGSYRKENSASVRPEHRRASPSIRWMRDAMRCEPSRKASARRPPPPVGGVAFAASAACRVSSPSSRRFFVRSMSSIRRWVSLPRDSAGTASHGAMSIRSVRNACTCLSNALAHQAVSGCRRLSNDSASSVAATPSSLSQADAAERESTGFVSSRSIDSRASLGPICPATTCNVSRSPSGAPSGITGHAASSSSPARSTRTCPTKLPLSTVET